MKRISNLNYNVDLDSEDYQKMLEFIKANHLYEYEYRNLPIPVFSYIKPTMGVRFILHIMLSLGEFDTELDLILNPTLLESLRYSRLIGPENDVDSLELYSEELLKKYILDQLRYFPNISKVLDQWIVTAGGLFDSVIIRNEIPITDMPPSHQTEMNESKDEEVLKTYM